MSGTVIAFMIIASIFAVGTIGYVIFDIVHEANPSAVCVCDNCYGEFVDKLEPTQVGADLIIGSLIKNPGAGIAHTGGYITGKHEFVELCAHRLSAPGVGREVGCTLNELRPMYQGLFFSPTVTASAVIGSQTGTHSATSYHK